MESFLIKALQLIAALSLLVVIHEFGHFLWARIFKIRVEKFYLFFNPWFSLAKWKPKNSDTEYGIGWLPLGGYVKIAGMIDESMDKEQMEWTQLRLNPDQLREAGNLYAISAIPRLILIDPEGRIVCSTNLPKEIDAYLEANVK